MGWENNWWDPLGEEPNYIGKKHAEQLEKNKRAKEEQKMRERKRRSDRVYTAQKHDQKVMAAIREGVKVYSPEELITMAKKGELIRKRCEELQCGYVVYTLPSRSIIECQKSGLKKLSGAVAIRIDTLDESDITMSQLGPVCISTREFTKISDSIKSQQHDQNSNSTRDDDN